MTVVWRSPQLIAFPKLAGPYHPDEQSQNLFVRVVLNDSKAAVSDQPLEPDSLAPVEALQIWKTKAGLDAPSLLVTRMVLSPGLRPSAFPFPLTRIVVSLTERR